MDRLGGKAERSALSLSPSLSLSFFLHAADSCTLSTALFLPLSLTFPSPLSFITDLHPSFFLCHFFQSHTVLSLLLSPSILSSSPRLSLFVPLFWKKMSISVPLHLLIKAITSSFVLEEFLSEKK